MRHYTQTKVSRTGGTGACRAVAQLDLDELKLGRPLARQPRMLLGLEVRGFEPLAFSLRTRRSTS